MINMKFVTIRHEGDLNSGHYYANIRFNNNWFCFNDSQIEELDSINKRDDSICLLFYERLN